MFDSPILCIRYILIFFLILAVTLRFNPTIYSINENNGILQPILILSAPLLTDFTLQVINIDSTASGKHNRKYPQQIIIIIIL